MGQLIWQQISSTLTNVVIKKLICLAHLKFCVPRFSLLGYGNEELIQLF